MIAPRHAGLLVIAASLATLAGCATTHGAAASSASLDLMAHDADVLAINARADSLEYGSTDYSRDGRHLAEQAQALRETLRAPRADEQDVTNELEGLASSYDLLREDANASANPNALAELRPVTRDYLSIEWDAQSALGHDRSTDARDRPDRS